jgi:hypothetical protein
MFPGKVRALVLDAASDPPAYTSGPPSSTPFLRANAGFAGSQTLDQFFVRCAAAGGRCALNEAGDPRTAFATLAQRLREAPLVLPDGRRVGYAELVDLVVGMLYRATDWAELASILLQVYAATEPAGSGPAGSGPAGSGPAGSGPAGSGPAGRESAARRLTATDPPAPGQPYNNVLESLWANVCGETSNPRNPFAYDDIAARAERHAPYVGAWWTYISLPCAVWPARDDDRYTGPWRTRTATPALVLNNRYDPATPLRNAVRLTELLIGSRLVVVEGWGHKALRTRSTCADAIVERYLIDGALPARGTTCQPGLVPFAGAG